MKWSLCLFAVLVASAVSGAAPPTTVAAPATKGGTKAKPDPAALAAVIDARIAETLKAHGVPARKPLHAPRKECGSLINEKYDLVTAKDLLRHSSSP